MFEFLLWAPAIIVGAGAIYVYTASRDIFHPLMILAPLVTFLYTWMPRKLHEGGGLDGFFQADQLVYIQLWVVAGVLALTLGCVSVDPRLGPPSTPEPLDKRTGLALLFTGTLVGMLGSTCWLISIINVGGLHEAFSRPYSGGWDDNGYIRDGSLLMFPAFILIVTIILRWQFRMTYVVLAAAFIVPWIVQAALTSRRGPTFMIAITLLLTWCLNRGTRPNVFVAGAAGVGVGLLMLFLVSNRGNLYLGSDQQFNTDISSVVEKPDSGNEYIYGAGSMISAEGRGHYFWGRRYVAQILVRPIPSSIWPTKYEDFGVPELMHNAGTAEGLADTLGWEGANGAAPGMIADLWVEFYWLNIVALWAIGRFYVVVWRQMRQRGGPYIGYYIVLLALAVYLVMQTMEAVIFRFLLMSVPTCLAWRFAGSPSRVRAFDYDVPVLQSGD